MKLCQTCNKNVAVVHSSELLNGKLVKEAHLCEACAAEAGLPPSSKVLSVAAPDLFGLLAMARPGRKEPEAACPSCGMTLQEFRVKGRLGCPQDYETFRHHLEALLEKVQGATRHAGRRPAGAPPPGPAAAPTPAAAVPAPAPTPKPASEPKAPSRRPAAGDKAIETLKKRLSAAVKEEKYEDAAKLRDQIAEAERARGGGRGGSRS